MENRQLYKAQVDINDMMQISQNAIMSRLNCHNVGKIIEFDSTTQTCTVQMMALKEFISTTYEPAPITDVPLIIYGAGGAQITLPNPVGSICLLFFMDRNIDSFLETGEIYTPATTRMHDYTDCIAITTFSTLATSLQNYDSDAISIIHNRIISEIAYTSIIKNYANSILLKRIQEGDTPTFCQVELTDKINLSNSTTDLLTLLNGFIDVVKNITISSNAVSSASKTALENYKTTFGNLLK